MDSFFEPTQRLDSTEEESANNDSAKSDEDCCGFLKIAQDDFKLVIGDNYIGRDPTRCQITVDSQTLSRVHAVIDGQKGGCTIMDMGSSNGTVKGSLKLKPKVCYELKPGDKIRCGDVSMVFFQEVEKENHLFVVPETPFTCKKPAISGWLVPDSESSPMLAKRTINESLDNSSSFLAPSQSFVRDSADNMSSLLEMETQALANNPSSLSMTTQGLLNEETQALSNNTSSMSMTTQSLLNEETQALGAGTSSLSTTTQGLLNEETQSIVASNGSHQVTYNQTKGSQKMEIDETLEQATEILDQPTQAVTTDGDDSNNSEDLLAGQDEDDLIIEHDDVVEHNTALEDEIPSDNEDVFDCATQMSLGDEQTNGRDDSTRIDSDSDCSSVDLIPGSQEDVKVCASILVKPPSVSTISEESNKTGEEYDDGANGLQSTPSLSQSLPENPTSQNVQGNSEEFLASTQSLADAESDKGSGSEDEADSLPPSPVKACVPSKSADASPAKPCEPAKSADDRKSPSPKKAIEIATFLDIEEPNGDGDNHAWSSDDENGDDIPDLDDSIAPQPDLELNADQGVEENVGNASKATDEDAEIKVAEPALAKFKADNENSDIEEEKKQPDCDDPKLDVQPDSTAVRRSGRKSEACVKAEDSFEAVKKSVKSVKKASVENKSSLKVVTVSKSTNEVKSEDIKPKPASPVKPQRGKSSSRSSANKGEKFVASVNSCAVRKSTRNKSLVQIPIRVENNEGFDCDGERGNTRSVKEKDITIKNEPEKTGRRTSTRRAQKKSVVKVESVADDGEPTTEGKSKCQRPTRVTATKVVVKPSPLKRMNRKSNPEQSKSSLTESAPNDVRRSLRSLPKSSITTDVTVKLEKLKIDLPNVLSPINEDAGSRCSKRLRAPNRKYAQHETPKKKATLSAKRESVDNRITSPGGMKRKKGASDSIIVESPMKKARNSSPFSNASITSRKSKSKLSIPKPQEAPLKKSRSLAATEKSPKRIATEMNLSIMSESAKSPLKRKAASKPVVMFTGYESPQDIKLIKELGGVVTSNVRDCSVLVTDKIRRTAKLLCILGRGIPIVSPIWLTQSKMARTFLDPWKYLMQDEESEKKWKFQLHSTLANACKSKLLDGYKVFATSNVLPSPIELKEIVSCAGGLYLSRMPTKPDDATFVISCEADKAIMSKIRPGISIVDREVLLTGLLRHKIDLEAFNHSNY